MVRAKRGSLLEKHDSILVKLDWAVGHCGLLSPKAVKSTPIFATPRRWRADLPSRSAHSRPSAAPCRLGVRAAFRRVPGRPRSQGKQLLSLITEFEIRLPVLARLPVTLNHAQYGRFDHRT